MLVIMDKLHTQLTNIQIGSLVRFVAEDSGCGLDKTSFEDALGLMLENISGMETKGPHDESEMIDRAYVMYCEFKQ